MGKLVKLASEIKAQELLRRMLTPDEMAALCGVTVDAVLVAMAHAVRRRHGLLKRPTTTLAEIAHALGLSLARLDAAMATTPSVPDSLRRWVAHHAWRPASLRHVARLAGIARGTAATIAHGRVRPEQDEVERDGALKPRRVARYYCETCQRWVYLDPCVICAAMEARYPEEDNEEDAAK